VEDQVTTPVERPPIAQFVGGFVVTSLLFPAIILGAGGNWRWIEGWLFALWFDVMVLANMSYLYFKDPALLAERRKRPGSDNQQGWDAVMLWAIYVIAMVWLIILPLDAARFHWSPLFPLWLTVVGGLTLLPALYLIHCATMENTFMSTLVRIQDDRGHRVVSTGVYHVVRHPLYLGALLMMIGGPLLVGSVAGLLVSALGTVGLVARILGEEHMLRMELKGYAEYEKKVPYRLIPLVW
jgi:protein-S-isoprenylcysteine O-methyltransferase Ste14